MENNIRIRIGVVIVKDGKILLIKQAKYGRQYWLIPGGGIDFGEKVKDCAKREIKEETGLDIELKHFLFLWESIKPDGSKHVMNFFFKAKILGGELKMGQEQNLVDLKYFDFEEMKNLQIYPPIEPYLTELKNNGFKPLMEIPDSSWVD